MNEIRDLDRYVVILNTKVGWGFSLNRKYELNEEDIIRISKEPAFNYVDSWEGYLPSFSYQRPEWVNDCSIKDFVAFWLY